MCALPVEILHRTTSTWGPRHGSVIVERFVDVPVGFSPATGARTWLAAARLIVSNQVRGCSPYRLFRRYAALQLFEPVPHENKLSDKINQPKERQSN
jgi:hypothetical protein